MSYLNMEGGELVSSSKVVSEFVGVICFSCRMFNISAECDPELLEPEMQAYMSRVAEFMAKYTFDVVDQWAEGYDEFSAYPCDCCGTKLAGERYAATFTEFVGVG